jgi:CheY-like chemotaxis protein
MKAPLPKTVLIVEDDVAFQSALVEMAKSLGFEVRACETADDGLRLAREARPTVIFSDVHLERGDGRKFLARLREDESLSDCQFVLMTGDWVGAPQAASVALAADAYLPKPFTPEEFANCLEERFRQANL